MVRRPSLYVKLIALFHATLSHAHRLSRNSLGSRLAVLILEMHNTSRRLWTISSIASSSSSSNSSRMKTGERRIIRLDELNRLVRLHRRIKRFSPVFIQDEFNDELKDAFYK